MSKNLNILIIGAGIAGLTAAYWLHQYGFNVELIEKAVDFKDRHGYMVDFWGAGYDVAEKMGVLPVLEACDRQLNQFIFLSKDKKNNAQFDIPHVRKLLNHRICTLLHGELEAALINLVADSVPVNHGVMVQAITQQSDQVEVVFNDGAIKYYDIVMGADGIHSPTRQLVFGDESLFSYDLGCELAAFIQPNSINTSNDLYTYAVPGKQISFCSTRDNQFLATYYSYRADKLITTDKQQVLRATFFEKDWYLPILLAETEQAKLSLYDRLTQIKMNQWYQDRIVLVGDACQCMTLMSGQGASMAMAGAYILAQQLKVHVNDHKMAFLNYQTVMQPNISMKQMLAESFLEHYIPKNEQALPRRSYYTRQFFKKMYELNLVIDD